MDEEIKDFIAHFVDKLNRRRPVAAVSNLSLLQVPLPASPRYDSRRTGGARREQKNYFVDEGLPPSNASVASIGGEPGRGQKGGGEATDRCFLAGFP